MLYAPQRQGAELRDRDGQDVAGRDGDRVGQRARHDRRPGRQRLAVLGELVRQPCDGLGRIAQNRGAGRGRNDLTVLLEDDADGPQIDARRSDASARDDETRRRGVVGDHVGQREAKVLVTAVDHFHRRRREGDRLPGLIRGYAGTGERRRGENRDLGLDFRVDQARNDQRFAFAEVARTEQKAVYRLVHAHLLLLRFARQAELEPDDPRRFVLDLFGDELLLDLIGGSLVERPGVGQRLDLAAIALRFEEPAGRRLGVYRRGDVGRAHFAAPAKAGSCALPSPAPWAASSAATCRTRSSCPPTALRRPTSSSTLCAGTPNCLAARSAWSKKLE